MKKNMLILPVFLVAVIGLILGAAVSDGRAATIQLDDSEIYIEINWTDGDAGIHIFLDGEGWDRMEVFDPDGIRIVDVMAEGSVGTQGITELFFESAEPSFEEQPLDEFLDLFPAGQYRFEGRTTPDEDRLRGTAMLTHNLPCAPTDVEAGENPDGDFIISWTAVTTKLDIEDGTVVCGEDPITIARQVVVFEFERNGTGETHVLNFELPDTATEVTVPPEFLDGLAGIPGEYKAEVIAIESSGNATITEIEVEL
jgi:hypothetical protein